MNVACCVKCTELSERLGKQYINKCLFAYKTIRLTQNANPVCTLRTNGMSHMINYAGCKIHQMHLQNNLQVPTGRRVV